MTSANEEARLREQGRYVKAFQNPLYAMGPERKAYLRAWLKKQRMRTYLDVGCGRGESLIVAQEEGFVEVRGTDVVPALVKFPVYYAEAHALPFGEESFQVVTCLDVLEHLLHFDHLPALREIKRVASEAVLVAAASTPASHCDEFGDLHPGRRPQVEWDDLVRTVFEPGWKVRALPDTATSHGWEAIRVN